MLERIRARNEWKFFAVLPRADAPLAIAWWVILVLRGVLPALFAIAMGALVEAVQQGVTLAAPLALVAIVFLLFQVLPPLHQAVGANLGDRTAAWLYDRLTDACVGPPGMGHLEDPALTSDLSMARDFDLGMTGPPLSISVDFIAAGLIELIGGLACACVLFGYAWWAPLLLGGAWVATHWLLRESAIWRDRNTGDVRGAQRDADYAFRLAVDPAPAKELRLFGLPDWVIDRFVARRTRLHALQFDATRLREKPVIGSMLLVTTANVIVFWSMANAVLEGTLTLGAIVVFAQSAVGTSMIASASGHPAGTSVLRLSRYVASRPRRCLPVPAAGRVVAIVGENGAGKTTLVKLLAKMYEPTAGAIIVDDRPLARIRAADWRERLAGAFQDFFRFEFRARQTISVGDIARLEDAPAVAAAVTRAGAGDVVDRLPAGLETQLGPTWPDGVEVSFGQWQKLALARGFMRDEPLLLILDEPTAALDAETEHALFERYAAAARDRGASGRITVLVSHRFSTVRMADLIVVLDGARIVESGTHEELMARGGRYAELYGIQAAAYRNS